MLFFDHLERGWEDFLVSTVQLSSAGMETGLDWADEDLEESDEA